MTERAGDGPLRPADRGHDVRGPEAKSRAADPRKQARDITGARVRAHGEHDDDPGEPLGGLDAQDRLDRREGLDDDETIVEDPELRRAKTVLTILVLALGIAFIAGLLLLAQPRTQTFVERWPNGYRRTETHFISAPNAAKRIEHGRHRAWHENGALAVEGTYDHGVPVGDWRYFDPTGAPTPGP